VRVVMLYLVLLDEGVIVLPEGSYGPRAQAESL
jgi:hypothetical protein